MNIYEVEDFRDVEFKKLGYSKLQAAAVGITNTYVRVIDGVVVYDRMQLDIVVPYVYLKLATDLFEDVDISQESVTDIIIEKGVFEDGLASEEYRFLYNSVREIISMAERENSTQAIINKAVLNVSDVLSNVLSDVQKKIESLSTKETIDALTDAIKSITKSLNKEDIDRVRAFIKDSRNEIN